MISCRLVSHGKGRGDADQKLHDFATGFVVVDATRCCIEGIRSVFNLTTESQRAMLRLVSTKRGSWWSVSCPKGVRASDEPRTIRLPQASRWLAPAPRLPMNLLISTITTSAFARALPFVCVRISQLVLSRDVGHGAPKMHQVNEVLRSAHDDRIRSSCAGRTNRWCLSVHRRVVRVTR